ncbi:MAG: AAA family ATPase, partial [bacterium]
MVKHIAVVAPIGAGKTTLAEYFQSKGFNLYKLTYAIYDECDRRGLDREDRTILQDIGDELRKKLGFDALAQFALKEVDKNKNSRYVIDSIRNHNELKLLMKT